MNENDIKQTSEQHIKDIAQIISLMRQDCELTDPRFKDYKKVSILQILNKSIKIQHWLERNSNFRKSKILKIYCVDIKTQQKLYFYTGSGVIFKQIQQIQEKINKDEPFLCIPQKIDKYYKLCTTNQGE